MTPPIKRGTARRLGIRPPQPLANYPQRWMLGMQEAVNDLYDNLAVVRLTGARPVVVPPPEESSRRRLSEPHPDPVTFTSIEGKTRTFGGPP